MRTAIILLMVMAMAGTAFAGGDVTSVNGPAKENVTNPYDPPQAVLQGGDTIFDAVIISSLPYSTTGTTAGFVNDYDAVCPYTGSTAPDVVYSFTPGSDIWINVDLCDSQYDTKTYILDVDLNIIDCNDDACGSTGWQSYLEAILLSGGQTYYIIVDGYGSDSGEYALNVNEYEQCFVFCDDDAVPEGEPAIVDGYIDNFNGGCNSDPEIYQEINWANDQVTGEAWLCGVGGWYINASGGNSRDLDWFQATAGGTSLALTVESEFPMNVVNIILPCGNPDMIGELVVADCGMPMTLTIPTTPGETYYFLIGSTVFTGPVNEFTYTATLSGHAWAVVPTEELSWGGVKALYR